MVKALGLLALVVGCGLLGIYKDLLLRDRLRRLEDFYRMILKLESQISYFKEPLLTLFDRTAKKGNTEAFLFLQDCDDALREKHGEINEIWNSSIEKQYGKAGFSPEDLEVLRYGGSFLGQTDYETQQGHFSYLKARLEERIALAQETCRVKGQMYRRIGFFGGAIAAILLL